MPSSCLGRGGEGRVQEDTRGDEAARLFTRMRECYSQPALTSCFKPAMALCCSINRVCKSCKNKALRVTRHEPQSQASHSESASQAHKQTAQVPLRTHRPASQSRAAHPQTPCWPALTRQTAAQAARGASRVTFSYISSVVIFLQPGRRSMS